MKVEIESYNYDKKKQQTKTRNFLYLDFELMPLLHLLYDKK